MSFWANGNGNECTDHPRTGPGGRRGHRRGVDREPAAPGGDAGRLRRAAVAAVPGARRPRCRAVADRGRYRGGAIDGVAGGAVGAAAEALVSTRTRLLAFAAGALGLGAALILAVLRIPDFSNDFHPYRDAAVAEALHRHSPNVVSSINFDQRGFDTLGEE